MKEKFERIIEKNEEFLKFYNIKKRIFPVYKLLNFFPDNGKLVDLGCGNGIFPALLALKHPHMKIVGIDDDERKIQMAKELFTFNNLSFIRKNIIEMDIPEATHFSLIDVLYLIPFEHQEMLIKKISEKIDNGLLLIKEMDKKPFYKYLFNYFQEFLSVKILKRTLGGKFFFRSVEDLVSLLSRYGFKTEIIRLDKGYLYPHILLKALKQ